MKILMVCLGNICRSPVAEGVMKHVAQTNQLDLQVDSAGTANYHVGESPDERSQASALSHGVDISNLRGRQFTVQDFDAFDRIYVMDKSNLKNVLKLARTAADKQKVDLLLNASHPGKNLEVPDPYYGGPQGFENAYQLVLEACEAIATDIKNG